MRKNDELIGNVSAIGSNMEGIVRIDEFICFVPYALLGEKIKFKVLKTTKNIAFCKLIEVLTPAEERVRPVCPIFTKCGGCQLQHLKYKEQLKLKTTLVGDCLKKIAGISEPVKQCIKSEYEFDKYFDLISSDKSYAEVRINKEIQTEILQLYKEYGIMFEISLKDKDIYIRFFTGDLFDVYSVVK